MTMTVNGNPININAYDLTIYGQSEQSGSLNVPNPPSNVSGAIYGNKGSFIINGTGMLQMFDILGRNVFSKEDLPLTSHLSILTFKPGVYVLRLINGDTVRTQKIVVK